MAGVRAARGSPRPEMQRLNYEQPRGARVAGRGQTAQVKVNTTDMLHRVKPGHTHNEIVEKSLERKGVDVIVD